MVIPESGYLFLGPYVRYVLFRIAFKTFFFGRPKIVWTSKKNCGRPKNIFGTSKILDVQFFWTSKFFLDVLKKIWTSKNLFGRPIFFFDVQNFLVVVEIAIGTHDYVLCPLDE